ncbi:MAG: translation initiation factor IF-2 N-terminal domain-containing protein, partial [Lachnospiraceae bacterium]|nr:translation initiation factor IF-2 N-terminal domain-containing protein [Lachnospiraceae bacterium]
MAKMRIHELAKELGAQSKDIIAVLTSLGVEGKTASSSIEEEQADRVRAKLSGEAPAKKSTKKAAEAPEEAPAKKSTAKAAKEEAPAKKSAKEAPEKEAASRPAPAKEGEKSPAAPVKKKRPNIILVSNPHNSQDRRGGYGGPRPTQSAPARPAGPARPQGRIVPNVKPLAPGESRLLQERAQEAANRQRAAENTHA